MSVRPTIEEQLTGALRLLDVVTDNDDLPPAARENLENVRRLLKRVTHSYAALPAFYAEDNQALGALLTRTAPQVSAPLAGRIASTLTAGEPPASDLNAPAERNAALRELLSQVLRELPAGAAGLGPRAEIGDYLRRRVALDPA